MASIKDICTVFIAWIEIHIQEGAWPSLLEFRRIVKAYGGPGRFYHTLAHIAACLRFINSCYRNVHRIHLVKLAIIYHDIIYDIRAKSGENERKSADRFFDYSYRRRGNRFGTFTEKVVYDLVVLTALHKLSDPDACYGLGKYMIDTDMHVLAADHDVYDEYARGVWLEYSAFGEEQYKLGRIDFLSKLDPHAIFYTKEMLLAPWIAADNIMTEIETLKTYPRNILVPLPAKH